MTLSAGTRLGSYEILAPLGAGGLQLDPASGSRRLLREISPIEPVIGLPQLLIGRDGKSYVYGTFRASSELYVVEGLK